MERPQDSLNWHKIEALLDAALEVPEDEREDFVLLASADEPDIAQRVLKLLHAERAAGGFLEETQPNHSPTSQTLQHKRIGPWRIERLLGRGGMASVYLAKRVDGQFEQQAALKLITESQPSLIERFHTERQILADLRHPGIAALLDGGLSDEGQPYMAMEYVDGLSLAAYCKSNPPLKQRLQIFLQICEAVAYAHRHLIVHRDLKPDNILIDQEGHARLLDFGIAKLIDPQLDSEKTQALATPNYAAPEQLSGQAITTATDVYGLGAILYFLLSQQPPLALGNCTLPQMIEKLLEEIPPPVSSVAQDSKTQQACRGDLDAICTQALQKDQSQRYESAADLAHDIQRHLDGHTVLAHPPSWRYRGQRWLKRHTIAASAVAAVMLSLMVGMSATAWQAHQAGLERDMARRDADRLSQMRSSILQLFRAASSQLDSDQLTVRALFSQGADTIHRDFADDPATAGALLQMLGELNLFTEDYAAAQRLLEQALSYSDQGLAPDILAAVENDLAHLAYREGNYERAEKLHKNALDHWQKMPGRYRSEILGAATLSSQLARAQGDTAAAVAILQEAAIAAREHWGHEHSETGIVLINLSVAHYYNNDLPGAIQACQNAWTVWQAIGLEESPDALNLLANWGLFALRYGQLWEGEKRLSAALELRSKLYGASAAQATLMKSLGVAHRLNGRLDEGMALLEQAEWMAAKYAGVGGRLHASASYALAWALKRDEQHDQSEAGLRALLAATGEHHSLWHSLNRALLASLPSLSQHEAEQLFERALVELSEYGPAAKNQYGEALALHADWLRQQTQQARAQSQLQQAIKLLTEARHPTHYRVLEMQADLADMLPQTEHTQKLRLHSRDGAIAQLGAKHPVSIALSKRAEL